MTRNYKGLDAFAVGLAENMIRFRWLVILLMVGITGYVATGAQHLVFSNNYRIFFSEDNPELRNFEEFQTTYSKSDNFLLLVVPNDGSDVFSNETLEAVHRLTEEAWKLPYARRVDSLTNFQNTYADGDELIVEDLILDPGQSSSEELAAKKAVALAEPLIVNQLVTDDARATAVAIVLNFPEKSLAEVPEAVAAVRALRQEVLADYPGLDIYLTGTSMLNNAFSEAVQTDFQSLIPAMILVILVTTVICVRSVSAMLSTLLLVILSCAAAMGWAGFVGIKLAGPSPSATVIILTLAIADSIHILVSARQAMRMGMNKRDAIIESIRINLLAVSITSVTTIVGFMSLNFADSPPFRDMGNISAVGIAFAWLLSLTLLPALLSIIPWKVKAKEGSERASFLSGLADFIIANYGKMFILTGIASATLISFIPQNDLNDTFVEYFDRRVEFRRDSDKVTEYVGFVPVEVQFKSGKPGGVNDPAFLGKLDDFTQWLNDYKGVTHVFSLSDIMKRLNKNLHADDPSWYRIPDDPELAAQYLLLYELSLPYGLDLQDRIDIDKSATRVTVTLGAQTTSKRTKQLLKDIDLWMAENAPEYRADPTGAQIMFTFIADRNLNSMFLGTSIAIGAIAIIMMIALRSFSMGILSLVPNGLPILSAFGTWALLVGEVGFGVAAVTSLSLGIVIDDTVHFLTKYNRARRENGFDTADSIRYAFETVGLAIFVNTVILVAGFMILTFSAFKINVEMGLLTCLSIGFALILDFLFLPALLLFIERFTGKSSSVKGDPHGSPLQA